MGTMHSNRIRYFRENYDELEGIATIPTDKAVMRISNPNGGEPLVINPSDWAGPIGVDSDRIKNSHAFCMFSITNFGVGPVTEGNKNELSQLSTIPTECIE